MKLSSKSRLSFLVLFLLVGAVGVYATTISPSGVYDTPWGNFTVGVNAPDYFRAGNNFTEWVETAIAAGGGGPGATGDLTVSFEYVCWDNATGSYFQNGQSGVVVGPSTEQQCLDWAFGNSTGGAILIKAATWDVIGLSDSTPGLIMGEGRSATVLRATGAGDVLTLPGLNQIVQHLSIDGNDAATDGLVLSGGRTRALHLYVYDCTEDGVEIASSGGAYIEDVRVRQVGAVRGAGTVGVNILDAAADIEVINCIISECEIGIDMSGGTNRVFTNHIWGNVKGITLCRDAAHGEYIIANNFIEDNTEEAIDASYYYTWATQILGNDIDGNGVAADDTYANIVFNQTLGATDHRDVTISNNVFDRISGGGELDRVKYHIWTDGGNGFVINGNINSRYSLTIGNPMFNLTNPSNFIVRDNNGYGDEGFITMSDGTGSITSGGTSDVITHGLDVTPEAGMIMITLTENPTNTPGAIWVDTITSTQFTVNCENDPGASNLDFSWYVDAARVGF